METTPAPTKVIGWQNRSKKIHGNARCGNGSCTFSSPRVVDAATADWCKRCEPGTTTDATAAVAATRRVNRRIDDSYAAEITARLTAALEETNQ